MEATSDGKRNRNYIVSEYLSKDGVDQTKIASVWQSPMDAGNTDPRDTSKTLAATPLAENSVSRTDIEDAVNKICRENMSLAETVLDWVREMISRVRGATMEAELRHIERLYRKGIAEAKKNAAQEGGTEYNIGKMETKNPPKDKRSPSERGGQSASAALVMDSEHSVSQENVPVKDSTTRFSLSEENKSIADQLNDSLPEIMAMESVSEIPIDERRVSYTGRKKVDEKAAQNVFRKQGLKAYRDGLGNIDLSRKGVGHSIYHGNNAAKQAAFTAVKDVIEHGKQVYEDQNHKGTGSDTYTFAAPVTFGTEKIGMAVVVKQTGNGGHPGYYIHEICDSKGNYIDLDENGNIIKKSASADLLTTANADADVQENTCVPSTLMVPFK